MNRREFLAFSAAAAAACAACAGCPHSALALAKDDQKPIDVGLLSELPGQAVLDKWSAEGFFLVRRDQKLYALSSRCTHKRVRLTLKGAQLKCSKHGSVFETTGELTKGPAKTPLPRYAISTDARGHVIVDRSRTFGGDDADDAAAYIPLSDAKSQ
jgi:nitrite reductase/ring-hydroxylating ferredoxin subunit